MKIYRVHWHDAHEGTCYEWFPTKSAAHERKRELDGEAPEWDHAVDTIEIDTDRKGLAAWLNAHFQRDNG